VVADQSWDKASGLQRVRFTVVDAWFTRWAVGRQLTIATSAAAPEFRPGRRHVVFLSGGPWQESPFTFRAESIFTVAGDGTLRCRSGNPLFGVLNDGFLCTAPELVQGRPIRPDQMRAQVLLARSRAARRLPDLDAGLAAAPRALELQPSAVDGEEVMR